MKRPEATLEEMRQDLDATSGVLSERARVIALGILGIWWSAHWGESQGHLAQEIGEAIRWPAFLSIAVLILDMLQYVAGFAVTFRLHRATEKAGKQSGAYDVKAPLYRARFWLFAGKLVLLGVAAFWLAIVVASRLSG